MRFRVLAAILIALSASLTLSLIYGQDRPFPLPTINPGLSPAPRESAPGTQSHTRVSSAQPAREPASKPALPIRDLSHLTPLQQQLLLAAQRGGDWMFRMHGVKGRFIPGYLPALKQEMEGDHFLRQAGAAFALARAARFTGEERYAVRAAQAVLALLDDTTVDAKEGIRFTAMPPIAVNRLASAAMLVLAINELPGAQKDLRDSAEQLCNFIRKQAQPSGKLGTADSSGREDEELAYSGQALYALMLQEKHCPARWHLELARKALPGYRRSWELSRSMTFVPYQIAACSEAWLATREKGFSDFVFAMSDWLCGLQYTQIDPKRMLWYGGFMSCSEGRSVETVPTVHCAVYAEGLVEACRVAREVGDVPRYQRYSEAVERCLQFLTTLQYTEAGTQHFAPWYRPRIVGAFHASHQDGNLRIDYTQHAVLALFGYLEHVPAAREPR